LPGKGRRHAGEDPRRVITSGEPGTGSGLVAPLGCGHSGAAGLSARARPGARRRAVRAPRL